MYMVSMSRLLAWIRGREEIVRVAFVAAIGTVLAWITYEFVFWANPLEPRAASSWIDVLSCVDRCFPDTDGTYIASLRRDVVASIGILSLSTLLNYLVTEVAGLHHRAAWVACVAFVAGFEYLVMKLFVFPQRRRTRAPRQQR